jgi:Cys-rich four helix bundle protein (predicted Tat secretion target)
METINRREWLTSAVGTVGALGILGGTSSALAEGKKKDPHAGHAMAAENNPYAKAIDAAAECAKKGELCIAHCQGVLAAGDTTMAGCMKTALEMVAACQGLVKLASLQSKGTKKMAALCAELCRECEKACKEHAEHHKVCKECMDSCNACAKECDKIA